MIKPEETKEYYIVTDVLKDSFEDEINEYLNSGWQLFGTTFIVSRDVYVEYFQTLIR